MQSSAQQEEGPKSPDFSILHQNIKKNLFNIIKNIEGKKSLIIDPSIKQLFAHIIGAIDPATYELEHTFQTLSLSNIKQIPSRHLIYITRPHLTNSTFIAKQILAYQQDQNKRQRKFHIVFVPYIHKSFSDLLKINQINEATEKRIRVYRLLQGFIQFDHDVLTLEWSSSFAEHLLQRDESYLTALNLAIAQLEDAYGYIPKRLVKGDKAARILKQLNDQYEQNGNNNLAMTQTQREIDGMIILDRSLDLITPFCMQQTFIGALDQVFNFKFNRLDFSTKTNVVDHSRLEMPVPKEELKSAKPPQRQEEEEIQMSIKLHSDEMLYKLVRDMHYNEVASRKIFFHMVKQVDTLINVEGKQHQQSLSQLQKYVAKVKERNLVEHHPKVTAYINAADKLSTFHKHIHQNEHVVAEHNILMGDLNQIYEYIGSKIVRKLDLSYILRLLILISQTEGGLKTKSYNSLRKELIHSYGFDLFSTLLNMEAGELFKQKATGSSSSSSNSGSKATSWPTMRKEFRLIADDIKLVDPNDAGYVYDGYTPLFSRFLQLLFDKGVKKFQEKVNKFVKGEFLIQPKYQSMVREDDQDESLNFNKNKPKKVILVVVVGGVTIAEISSLRYVAKERGDIKVIVASTQIINGRTALAQMSDQPMGSVRVFEG